MRGWKGVSEMGEEFGVRRVGFGNTITLHTLLSMI